MNYNIRKPDLILLHGALGSQVQFSELSKKLSSSFTIHTFNFSGYGGRPIDQAPSIELFSQNLIDYIVENDLVSPFVFGYSMGGYVALNARSIGIAMEKLMHWRDRDTEMVSHTILIARLWKCRAFKKVPSGWNRPFFIQR